MSGKGGMLFRIVAGAYVAYTGVTLFINAYNDRPEHYIMYLGIGVVFAIFGVLICGFSLKKLREANQEEQDDSEE